MTKAKILRVIRQFCLECMGGSVVEIENCTAPKCQLFDFRRGKDPMPSRRGPKRQPERSTDGVFLSRKRL